MDSNTDREEEVLELLRSRHRTRATAGTSVASSVPVAASSNANSALLVSPAAELRQRALDVRAATFFRLFRVAVCVLGREKREIASEGAK